jgi:putative ABC transport system permease protein
MIGLLSRLLGRLPIGYLQLVHNRGRLIAALAGVSFANVLVFVQLGLAGSMATSVATPYGLFRPGLVMVSAHGAETFSDSATIPRQRLFQALTHPQVVGGTPIYLGQVKWLSGRNASSSILFVGVPTDGVRDLRSDLRAPAGTLSIADTALVDLKTRFVDMRAYAAGRAEAPVFFEVGDRRIGAVGTVSVGGGFAGDGMFIVSDQTFFGLFPRRSAATPSHVLLGLAPGADAERVAAELQILFPEDVLRIRPVDTAVAQEQVYQMTERPTGLIFAFGVGIGLIVGVVIAYQVLSTDVADHLREYATFKAMGYGPGFFTGVVLEEAVILGAIGFWPGLLFSMAFYETLAGLTNLPIAMTVERAAAVFVGTVAACAISGLLAMRKVAAADPADLF